jgi:hypothetical protein
MNNFNLVLSAIKKQCIHVNEPDKECFNAVQSELDISYQENLDLYLDFLQDLGLITYNNKDRSIALTELGSMTKIVFK